LIPSKKDRGQPWSIPVRCLRCGGPMTYEKFYFFTEYFFWLAVRDLRWNRRSDDSQAPLFGQVQAKKQKEKRSWTSRESLNFRRSFISWTASKWGHYEKWSDVAIPSDCFTSFATTNSESWMWSISFPSPHKGIGGIFGDEARLVPLRCLKLVSPKRRMAENRLWQWRTKRANSCSVEIVG